MLGRAVAALALTAFALAGCGISIGDKTLDKESVENAVLENLETRGANIRSVECPADQGAADGTTFECTVRYANGNVRVAEVELVDDDGSFRYTIPPGQTAQEDEQ